MREPDRHCDQLYRRLFLEEMTILAGGMFDRVRVFRTDMKYKFKIVTF